MIKAFASYKQSGFGGRALVLFLLFLLALYNLKVMGITGMALVCMIPAGLLFLGLSLKRQNMLFWFVFTVNYFVMGLQRYGYIPVPVTAVTLGPQLLLLISFVVTRSDRQKNTLFTPMLLGIIVWTLYLVLQLFNHTCGLPTSVPNWLQNMNFYSFYFIIAYVLISKIVNTPENVMRFLRLWAYFSIAAAFWAWRQKTFGWDTAENAWLMGGAMRTHIIGGSIRYFSFFSDAATFGCNMGSAAVLLWVVFLTSKLKKDRILFGISAVATTYGMFTSGTRSGLMCFLVGLALYVLLSKSIKLAAPVVIAGGLFVFFLAFTKIGDGNMLIRRMRTAFDTNDASKNVRDINKEALKKYLRDAPFGMGINIDETRIPAFNKFKVVYETSNDSTYVFFWQRTGIVGVYVFAFMNILILTGGCVIVLTRLRTKHCQGIGGGLCCAFLAINAGGYANHILMQYPNLLLFYGGMAIVYLLPAIEDDFEQYMAKEVEQQEERKRLKLEQKKQSRV